MTKRNKTFRKLRNRQSRKLRGRKLRSRKLGGSPSQKGQVLVYLLYMNGCGHCEVLEPEWKKVKEMCDKSRIKFVDVERNDIGTVLKDDPIEVQGGFPTIAKKDKNGKVSYYVGERTATAIYKWINSK